MASDIPETAHEYLARIWSERTGKREQRKSMVMVEDMR